jgi:hypothetical protein
VKKTGRINIPVFAGAYTQPGLARSQAQDFFLSVVPSVAPGLLYSLRDEILPKYRSAFKFEKKKGLSDDEAQEIAREAIVVLAWTAEFGDAQLPPEFGEGKRVHARLYKAGKALLAWQNAFNLCGKRSPAGNRDALSFQNENWALITALETILFWHFHPRGPLWERSDPPKWRPPFLKYKERRVEPELLPKIQLRTRFMNRLTGAVRDVDTPAWCTEAETEPDLKKRLRYDFERWLDAYVMQRKQLAQTAGLVTRPRKLVDHLSWAVKFQVGGMSTRRISRESDVSEAAVEDAIQPVFDLVNLERRPGQRGPARGPKNL